ncbi:MAG: DUF4351 domain-containing protein [Magnetococcales bacterium]|nr:DUF4351 domain-containing protein [Magnetococcales bacterium]
MMSQFAQDIIAQKQPEWIQKGEQIGERKGEQKVLLRLLHRRFPELPVWVERKVSDAKLEALAEWTDRILDAHSLQDIFGDEAQPVH